jgi:predicted DNA-binding transcriptional regulator YafY
MQTPFSTYKPQFRLHLIDVIVEVDKSKARFFKAKKFLPSQKIQKESKDGSLTISYKLTQELEIDDLIKRWIPHIRVIEPLSLKEKIEGDLREYLHI